MYHNLILKLIELIHLLVSVFLAIGGYIIPKKYIPIYLLSLPYIVIDWNDIDNTCWLTKLYNRIQNESNEKINNENDFLYTIAQRYGINMKQNTFTFILYVILISNWLYAYYRFMNQYKIKLFPNDFTKYIVYSLIIGWLLILLSSL